MTAHLTKPIRAIHFMFLAFLMIFGGAAKADFFGFFKSVEQRTFPVCQRDIHTDLDGKTLEINYFKESVFSYEVICGYRAGVSPSTFGLIGNLVSYSEEDRRLISKDTPILGANFTTKCQRYSRPPPWKWQHGWLKLEQNLYCSVPNQGERPKRD
jgi:hypothetical protein